MNSKDFVAGIMAAAPSQKLLLNAGFSVKAAEAFRESFSCRRKSVLSPSNFADPLNELLSEYDLTSTEIGMVRFLSEIMEVRDGLQFGLVEDDPLVISGSGEIVVLDRRNLRHILWRCAKNGGLFLDALLSASKFLAQCAVDEDLYIDNSAASAQASECAALAGGARYLTFFQMLLGARD